VQDAEANREEDKKFHELVTARNMADAAVHSTRSAIKEHGDKVPGDQLGAIETALSDLETAMKGDDKAQIEAKTEALSQAAQSLYAAAGAGAQAEAAGAESQAAGDDVVDAEFTEVKDDQK
jgi:molecular chaperone DnaK